MESVGFRRIWRSEFCRSRRVLSVNLGLRHLRITPSLICRIRHSPLQKRESAGACFLYWFDWKSKHFNWNVNEWTATQPSLRVFSGKLSKWEPCKSCKIPLKCCGLSTQSIQTLHLGWYLMSYNFAIFLLQVLLFVVKTLKFSWSFIWISWFFKQTENNHTISQSSSISAMAYNDIRTLCRYVRSVNILT